MDIFFRNLPEQMSEKQVNKFLQPYLNAVEITTWRCDKLKSKGCAVVTIADVSKSQRFLTLHGQRHQGRSSHLSVPQPLWHMSRYVSCSPSNKRLDKYLVSSLEREEKEKQTRALALKSTRMKTESQNMPRGFKINQFWCGQWDYYGNDLIFQNYYHADRKGKIVFGHRGIFVSLYSSKQHDGHYPENQLEISYRSIDSYTTGSQKDASLTFSLTEPPKLFEVIDPAMASAADDPILIAMRALLIKENKPSSIRRKRVTNFDQAHGTVVGACLCYRFQLEHPMDIKDVQSLKKISEIPGSIYYPTTIVRGPSFVSQTSVLNQSLAAYPKIPFDLKFQLQRLAQNGSLPPYRVSELLVAIDKEITPESSAAFVDAIYQLYGQIPFPGPNTEASAFSLKSLLELVIRNRERIDNGQSFRESWEQYEHLILVHKAHVTPSGVYLAGPQAEVKNRVLRKYAKFSNHFLSVSFSDEDGESIRHDRHTSNEDIFHVRFKKVLEGVINIAGQGYQFLGFSHSSLRAHTCWFMAPFGLNGTLTYARAVIKNLGDFTRIRSPAKCAARIGQAFSQTMSAISLPPEAIQTIPDVERNGRTFSDGVGVCSIDVLHKVWDEYKTARDTKPTVIQVRIQGAKGVLSLDSTLKGLTVYLRPSMIKFEGTNVSDIEICGSASKPLPMILNRQLIKIFEDLGVKSTSFLALQSAAIDELRSTTRSAETAARFLSRNYVGVSAKLPWLIQKMSGMGLQFTDNDFLENTLELAVLAQLRELKYRARIPVEKGATLYGIMDETGFLEEGEVYCSLVSDIITGIVTITRSPALHPGDVRCVNAVEVPFESPLRKLHNVVVFSQKGNRDLPSMLSGGDLDGDLYNIIYDPQLRPKKIYPPAEYATPKPIDIGRPVEASDMTLHFLSFMENDALGRIATLHQIIADQSNLGVLDQVCLHLARLHSDAVDFSKTGIPVPFEAIPRYPNARPDFLANGPRVMIDEKRVKLNSDELFVDLDQVDEPEDLAEAASYATPRTRYYESTKVLGELYRNIDEYKFLEQLQKQAMSSSTSNQDTIGSIWNYVRDKCILIQWEQYIESAKDIKESYEDNLVDIMMNYSTQPHEFLSEAEVFSGSILGKHGGASKQQRENSVEMKTKFDRDVAYTVQCIKTSDDGSTQDALARSIACLYVSLATKNTRMKVGVLNSFQWVAASTCLKEVEDMLSGFE